MKEHMNVDKLLVKAGAYFGGDGVNYERFDPRKFADLVLAETTLQRQWVGLTDEEIDQGLLRSDYAMQTAHAWRAGVVFAMTKLKEKNT